MTRLLALLGNGVSTLLGNWQMLLGGMALSAALGAFGTYKIMHNANLAAQTRQAVATVRLIDKGIQINVSIGDVVVRGVQIVHDHTAHIQQEIPAHVTPEIDRTYPVPLGFVRVWNDASHGPVPGPAAGRDEDPSGVHLSTVAAAHATDEGTLDECRVYLKGWWDWYDQQAAAWNKTAGH